MDVTEAVALWLDDQGWVANPGGPDDVDEQVVVTRIGGAGDVADGQVDDPILQLDVWGRSYRQTAVAAKEITARLCALTRVDVDDVTLLGAQVTSNRFRPEGDRPRFVLTVLLSATVPTP